ncbi:Uncharacterized protein OS=Roseiflexus sp. (strain RS-1) GN=RoseRS_2254 PE=4 SV=1: DUF955 [Gemmata massiliana]|uniref:IrrE N-terminal-like domain-containing protein n=1 Tax=Gemmata massiliana TaxID=1210884 RepID=A0A6P2D2G4_9BACT|nr:ImmA/IrrE family metallo-endopeptidase [Gemmata massiliana]VTR93590.1 Uncharacterized protein OS=Roseiflexus sp. (strain RS-1) GN=RoseRS_2254 PE=4 SV=1: DUF955 [Gemmata massiliana]
MIARPEVWVLELAARFWAEVGHEPGFPRDLRDATWNFPDLHVKEILNLSAATVAQEFARHNVPCAPLAEDRQFYGCFGARRGVGVILVDPTLPADELRFTFAHELAHFLRDCREARRRAVARFGTGILDVLDGNRPATPMERLAGALRGVTIGSHTHFLERDRWGRVVDEATWEAEEAADRLAFELLAPFNAVDPEAAPSRAALVSRLISVFGLPTVPAEKYAILLRR